MRVLFFKDKAKDPGAENVLDTTTSFHHWKRIVLENHPKARFLVEDGVGAVAVLGQFFVCGNWDMQKRVGKILHKPTVLKRQEKRLSEYA